MALHPLPSSAADRNLLFGILALQLDFITREQLVAGMNFWVLEKSKPLGDILVEQKALRQDFHAALAVMVDKHLEVHGHDAQRSLQAISSLGSVRQELQHVGDADVQASLAHLPAEPVGAEPRVPEPTTIGMPTSAGTRFRILRPHAKGGLGQVFVAHDEELHREVALKEIQDHNADNPAARSRFVLEAEITGGLEHPGIVPVYGLGQYPDGRPFYAMRFIRGDSLKAAIESFHKTASTDFTASTDETQLVKSLDRFFGVVFRQLLGRFVDVCNAVAYAHSRGVLHRDLKPGNIMLGKYGETLLVDWGLARAAVGRDTASSEEGALVPASGRDNSSKTQAGAAIGTPQFMSPEQAAGRLDLMGPASDIYSLGATLYVLLAGALPFLDKDTGKILQKVQRGEFAPPRRIKPGVPAALNAICQKAMALRPGDRYATALNLAADIEHWLADEPVGAWSEPTTVKLGRWMRKHKPLVSGAAAALLVGVLAASAGTVWYQREESRREADAIIRQAEAVRKRGQAEQAITEALDQAEKARDELHALLRKPGGVFALLNEPARWQAHLQAVLGAIVRAKAVLANAADVLPDAALAQRAAMLEALVGQDDAERLLALRLDKIRLDRSTVSGAGFDNVSAARAYPIAFAEAKFAIYDDARSKAPGAQIAASPIKDQLVAALDDWAGVALGFRQFSLLELLLRVARQADPDPLWRDRFRQARVWRDPEALGKLVEQPPPDAFSPQLYGRIANLLAKNSPLRVNVLKDGLARYPADFWLNLQMSSELQTFKLAEAVGYVRTAVAVRPHSAAAYNNLGNLLGQQRLLAESRGAFAKALEIEPHTAAIHSNLGGMLRDLKQLKEALVVLEKAVALDANCVMAFNNLGSVLGDLNRPDESLVAHLKAIELDPNHIDANNNLGAAFNQLGRTDDAIAAYEKTIALDPRHATAYSNLALVLHEKKRYQEAAEASQKAIDINPKSAVAYNHLGMALDDLNRVDEALAAFRKSIELKEDFANAHYNLGLTLHKRKRWDEAVAAFKKAVAIEPNLPHRQGALGKALLQQGAFAEALEATQKALDLLPAQHPLRRMVEGQRAACMRALAREERLGEIVDNHKPAAAKELLELAQFCQSYKERHVTALRLYRQALEQEPKLAEDANKQVRYNAACSAALVGLGTGPEAAPLPEAEKMTLRRQAHDWLRADLAGHAKQARSSSVGAVLRAEDRLTHWQKDDDLVGVRAPKELDKLPPEERQLWQKLWADVRQTLTDGKARFSETQRSGALSAKEKSTVHVVSLAAGKTYVLELTSTAFDTFLKLEDPCGKPLQENDDISAGNLNSRLVFQAPAAGAYRIIATSYQERGTGVYTLRIREFVP